MRRVFFLIITLLPLALPCRAAVSLDTIVSRLATQSQLYIPEKVALHVDHNRCYRGEAVRYRAYCLNGVTLAPSDTSRFVYVELIDSRGTVLQRVKNINDYGCAVGYIKLTPSLKPGVCFLRAYTRRSIDAGVGYATVLPLLVDSDLGGEPATSAPPPIILGAMCDLNVTATARDLRFALPESQSTSGLSLLLVNRLMPFYFVPIKRGDVVAVNYDNLPPGISRAVVLNDNYDIVGEATFAVTINVNPDYHCPASVDTWQNGVNTSVSFALPQLADGETAQLSLAIARATAFDADRDMAFDLTVASEIDGGTGWDVGNEPQRLQALLQSPAADSLLQAALHASYRRPNAPVEVTTTITGRVEKLLPARPLKDAKVSAISPQADVCSFTTTGDDGRFTLGGLDGVGENQFIVQANRSDGSDRVFLRVDEPTYPAAGASRIEREPFEPRLVAVTDGAPVDTAGTIVLDNVTVRGFRYNNIGAGGGFSQFADFSLSREQIDEYDATCLHELLRRVPGVFVRDDRCYIRAHTSIYGDNPAAIAIDGLIDLDYDLHSIQMQDVERVDVFKTGSTAIWGHRGGSGVISIKLKEGSRRAPASNDCNITTIKLPGIQPLKAPKPSAQVLYWLSDVTLKSANSAVAFDVDFPPAGNYELIINGITSEGRIIQHRAPIAPADN